MQNYPKASLVQVKGKCYVQVTVPEEIRPALKNRRQLRRRTGTADRAEAERRLHAKAAEIYAQFDDALRTYDPLTITENELMTDRVSDAVISSEPANAVLNYRYIINDLQVKYF